MNVAQEKKNRRLLEKFLKGYPCPEISKLQKGHKEYDATYSYSLNYTNAVFDFSDLKDFTQEYFGEKLSLEDVPDWEFRASIGTVFWVLSVDGYINSEKIKVYENRIKELVKKYRAIEEKKAKKLPVTEQDPFISNTNKVQEELDGILDDSITFGADIAVASEVIEKYGNFDREKLLKFYKDVKEDYEDENSEIIRSSEWEEDKELLIEAVDEIISTLEEYEVVEEVKEKRGYKTRANKPKSADKQVSKLNYMEEYKELGLVSINPQKIIGAEVLWVFNTKTRFLGCFISKDNNGFTVNGSTLYDFNEELSICKKIRKPDEIIPQLMAEGKVFQKKLLSTIKAKEKKLKGRINDDCILLRIF